MKKQNYLFILLSLVFISMIGQTVHNITSPDAIEDLVLAAGDEIILQDGEYNSDERITFSGIGTASSPITFRPETPGGVIFTNGLQMNIDGEYLVVDGFYWNGGYGASNFIQFRNGGSYSNYCTIQNCAINGLVAEPGDAAEALAGGAIIKHRWVVLYGTYNNVLNCTFMNKNTAGALVLAEYEYNASTDGVTNTRCEEVGHVISNNYFFNFEKMDASLSNSGDSETIRIGTSEYQNVNSAAIVSGNYFVQADGENEIITNKSMNNTYFNNTFRRSRGSLVMRHGANATVDSNYFLGENVEGTGGIRIADSNHQITNNYIQDCLSTDLQGPWNNALTFVGGNTNSVQDCLTTSVTNAYQDVENINFSNNTFINTHSPFYFNATRDGADDVFGEVSNNLIYFEANNDNITNVIEGSYTDIGSNLAFSGNIYNDVTALDGSVTGFSEESITVSKDGEIFIHDQTGKGASISEGPITDSMVGNGVGACFLDYNADFISNPSCAIVAVEPIDSMNISSVSDFSAAAGEAIIMVNANISWTASSNDDWISISSDSGEGDATLTVSVDENTDFVDRSGSITFNQVDGDIVRILSISQDGRDLITNYILINDKSATDNVIVHSFSKEQVGFDDGAERFNYATNTLDKDPSTRWAANDLEDVEDGDIKADGEYVIYDLGAAFNLGLIQLSTDGKAEAYGYQIWTSNSGVEDADFTKLIPDSEDIMLSEAGSSEFQQTEVSVAARYVKLVGFGRFNSDITVRESVWTNITEIEFFRTDEVLSVDDFTSAEALGIVMYPNPVADILTIDRELLEFNDVAVYSVFGNEVLRTRLDSVNSIEELDLSNLSTGIYFVQISNGAQKSISKIMVSK